MPDNLCHQRKSLIIFSFLLCLVLLPIHNCTSQSVTYQSFGKGIQVMAEDSTFGLKLGFRFQTLYSGILDFDSNNWNDQLLIRRARLKFDGFAFSPNLEFKIELGLANRDLAGGNNAQTGFTSRIILDALLKWNFYNNWYLWVGQTKLPGNRERVISSQKLQFVDRSLVNSRFNIDRDIGVQLRHEDQIGGGALIREIGSISMGEGRNVISNNAGGYDYTLRFEYLPFGEFSGEGDYYASDLAREDSPKLALGVSYDFNDDATKQGGQLGSFTADSLGSQVTNDLSTIFVDAIFKYRGISIHSEYAHRSAQKDILVMSPSGDLNYRTGHGFVLQGGYLLDSNFEIAFRYTRVKPDSKIFSSIVEESEYTLGLSRYIADHNFKVQSDLGFHSRPLRGDFLQFRLQCEFAF